MAELLPPTAILPHRPPFLFIDEVIRCEQTEVVARRTFRKDEDFFRGHFPERAIVPGVLLLEGMAQTFAYLALQDQRVKSVFLTGVEKARFRQPVVPGQTVEFSVALDTLRLGVVWARGEARVDGKKIANARLSGVFSDKSAESMSFTDNPVA